MNLNKILESLNEIVPFEYADQWDNVGLIIGNKDSYITKALICLDVTVGAVNKAIEEGANLIISHHPVIFNEMKRITNPLYLNIIENRISVVSLHTNYDCIRMNNLLADSFGLTNAKGVISCENSKGFLAVKGQFEKALDTEELINITKRVFHTDNLKVTGKIKDELNTAIIAAGGLGSFVTEIMEHKADVFITGEIKYNSAVELYDLGILSIEAGHYETEKLFIDDMSEILNKELKIPSFGYYMNISNIL